VLLLVLIIDIGYKVADICDDEGHTGEMSALSISSVYVYNGCLAWYDVLLYHSSVEWLISDVTYVSNLNQLSVFHA